MSEYVLSCCSTADLSKEHLESRNIEYVCFNFMLNGVQYPDDLGETVALDDFYKQMENGAETRTSQVNVDKYIEFFTKFLDEGKDIIHISFSSGLSGSSNSARIASEELAKKYPNQKIYVVDSLAASSGFGLLVDKLADLRDDGFSIDELYNWAMDHRLQLHHWFFSTDLTFYVKGGRISKASGWFGTVLKICPLLNVDLNGKLVPRFKIRGKNAVIKEIVKKMEENAIDGTDYSGKCFISHSACLEDAIAVKDLVKKTFKKVKEVKIFNIGTTIGSHTGPGTVALFFWGSKRVD